jgi:hypothetical protein
MMAEPFSHLITRGEVLDLHKIGIRSHGGFRDALKPESGDCVDGKLGSAWHSELLRGQEIGALYGLCFAGHLLYYLARAQCFADGNKRVAWASAMTVLAALGLTIRASQQEVTEYVELVAAGRVTGGADVVLWLAHRLEAPPANALEDDASNEARVG